jgi:hypothetical protein
MRKIFLCFQLITKRKKNWIKKENHFLFCFTGLWKSVTCSTRHWGTQDGRTTGINMKENPVQTPSSCLLCVCNHRVGAARNVTSSFILKDVCQLKLLEIRRSLKTREDEWNEQTCFDDRRSGRVNRASFLDPSTSNFFSFVTLISSEGIVLKKRRHERTQPTN